MLHVLGIGLELACNRGLRGIFSLFKQPPLPASSSLQSNTENANIVYSDSFLRWRRCRKQMKKMLEEKSGCAWSFIKKLEDHTASTTTFQKASFGCV